MCLHADQMASAPEVGSNADPEGGAAAVCLVRQGPARGGKLRGLVRTLAGLRSMAAAVVCASPALPTPTPRPPHLTSPGCYPPAFAPPPPPHTRPQAGYTRTSHSNPPTITHQTNPGVALRSALPLLQLDDACAPGHPLGRTVPPVPALPAVRQAQAVPGAQEVVCMVVAARKQNIWGR